MSIDCTADLIVDQCTMHLEFRLIITLMNGTL